MSDPTSGIDPDQRWQVVDERRFSWIPLDTRLLVDGLIDGPAFTIYAGLVWHADRADTAWPSLKLLASYPVVSVTRARQAIRALVTAGYIRLETRAGGSNVYVLVDLRDGPKPPGRNPWNRPPSDPEGGVEAGPRDYSEHPGGPPAAREGPQARDYSPPGDPDTPSDSEGVLSTTPSESGGDPLRSRGGSSTQNQRTTPLPPAGFAAPRGRRGRRSPGQGLSRGPVEAPAPRAALTDARHRAITLAANLAPVIRDGDMTRDDLAARVRTECRSTGLLDRVETEQVVQTALTTVDEVLDRAARNALAAAQAAAPTPLEGELP